MNKPMHQRGPGGPANLRGGRVRQGGTLVTDDMGLNGPRGPGKGPAPGPNLEADHLPLPADQAPGAGAPAGPGPGGRTRPARGYNDWKGAGGAGIRNFRSRFGDTEEAFKRWQGMHAQRAAEGAAPPPTTTTTGGGADLGFDQWSKGSQAKWFKDAEGLAGPQPGESPEAFQARQRAGFEKWQGLRGGQGGPPAAEQPFTVNSAITAQPQTPGWQLAGPPFTTGTTGGQSAGGSDDMTADYSNGGQPAGGLRRATPNPTPSGPATPRTASRQTPAPAPTVTTAAVAGARAAKPRAGISMPTLRAGGATRVAPPQAPAPAPTGRTTLGDVRSARSRPARRF